MKNKDMYDNFIRCKKSKFWAENLILEAIDNWILKKYSEATLCQLIDHDCISIHFFNPNKDKQDEIIKEICDEFKLNIKFIEQGCRLDCENKITKKFREYILYKR